MARPKPDVDRVRINLIVPSPTKERILRIQAMIEADTMTEVVRRALLFYEQYLQQQDSPRDR